MSPVKPHTIPAAKAVAIRNSVSREIISIPAITTETLPRSFDLILVEEKAPLLYRCIHDFIACGRDRRKVVAPLPRPAGVDNGAGVLVFTHPQHWIERAAPAIPKEFDIVGGFASGRHRPDHVERIGGIDVIVNDDNPPAHVVAGMAGIDELSGLSCMAGIKLFYRNYVEEPRTPGLVGPDSAVLARAS